MHKKGSLELSVNAIVIIVLAIAMLGLGIAFTKNMFGKFSDQFTIPEPTINPTSQDPIALYNEEMSLPGDKTAAFTIPIMNTCVVAGTPTPDNPTITCVEGTSTKTVAFNYGKLALASGETGKFKVTINKADLTSHRSKTYICTIQYKGGTGSVCSQKQFTLSIT